MADRLTLIMQLGMLSNDAAQRGDDRAAETLREAAEMLFADKRIDKVRQRDRERKHSPRIPPESTGIHGGSQGFSPTPPFPNPPIHHEDNTAHAENDPMLEINRGLLQERMGDLFADVESFVKRRAAVTWAAWYGEMLSILTGGKSLPEDLAQVCRDDAALARAIGSPKGLRTFVNSAVAERVCASKTGAPRRPPTNGGTGERAYATTRGAIEDL